jgi:glycosyltransferase involved in cell wall biosynthesis
MKILFMANVAPNPSSGAAGTEFQTMKALRELGHTVDDVWTDELSHHLGHFNLYNLLELPIAYRDALRKRLLSKKYDVVHVNQPHGYLAAKALRTLDLRAIFVHRSHGLEGRVRCELARWERQYGQNDRPAWRRACTHLMDASLELNNLAIARYAHGHIVSASECRDFLHNRYGVPLERIAVIAQAPPEKFRNCDAKPMTEKRLQKILYVGQYAFFKAPMVLAREVEHILTALPRATMTWVCDAQHHGEARRLFQSERLAERVSFVAWRNQLDLMQVYDEHGIFLFPSFLEGFGKAFLEAMSRGLVVVASNNGGMKDVIKDGESGFLAKTGDWRQMADLAIQAVQNPELSIDISTEARRTSLNYSWNRVAIETACFYASLIASDVPIRPDQEYDPRVQPNDTVDLLRADRKCQRS